MRSRTRSKVGRARQAASALLAALLLSPLLAGCQAVERINDSKLTGDTPLDWWHQLEGGVIAQERPPPPGVGSPYPNLDQVPGQKPSVDTSRQQALQAQLAAERDQVRREIVQDPLPAAAPSAHPAPTPPPATADPEASHIVADAATAPAPPTPPPAPAAAAVPAPPPTPRTAPVAPGAMASGPASSGRSPSRAPAFAAPPPSQAAQPAAMPVIPDAPPPVPDFAGVTASLVPAASRPGPPGVEIGFGRGSAALPPGTEDALRALAARRAGVPIVVRAGGDAGPSPAAQAAALPLALRRADAVRAALVAAGVPADAVRATALAAARGTRADLIQTP